MRGSFANGAGWLQIRSRRINVLTCRKAMAGELMRPSPLLEVNRLRREGELDLFRLKTRLYLQV
jgi:hypothetical protein